MIYEIALLTLAFSVVLFDFVHILGNNKPIDTHKQKQAALHTMAINQATFNKSCEGVDMKSDDLKTVVQRGFCSMSSTK